MRRVGEVDAAGAEFFIRRMNVGHAEIKDRGAVFVIALRQEQPDAVAVEESEIAESEEVRQAQFFLVEKSSAVLMSFTVRAIWPIALRLISSILWCLP